MKSSIKEFIAEAEELLDESHRLILEIQETSETGVDPDTLNALFRSMHTLKGVSGLFGLQAITDLSHALETLMDDVRLGKIDVNTDTVNFLFKNLDILKSLVDSAGSGKEEDARAYLEAIESFRESQKGTPGDEPDKGLIDESITKVLSEYEEHRLNDSIKKGKGIYLIKAVFELAVFDTSLENLTKLVKTLGELVSTLPTSSNVPDGSIGFNLLVASDKSVDAFKTEVHFEIDALLQPKIIQPEMPAPAVPQDTLLKSTTTTVRVDIEKIDRILNTIGELTLAKEAVKRIGTEFIAQYGHSSLIYDINKISQTLERRLAEIQYQVLEIRMVPIGQIFSRLAQVIRRYSREIDKQIELHMFGEDTEIDKYLAEEIIDPLMHIVRNSIDHGIETPDERTRTGKSGTGTITLKAYQQGNHVMIEISDDGAGISIEEVRKKAIEKGLIDTDAELEEKEIVNLVFTPGFSTKDTVSEVSGRGVGMDVVKEKLSALGGFADIITRKGHGTTFIVTLPITLAIIKALIVNVEGKKFAVPLTSMSETLVVEQKHIQTIEWKEVYYLRGEMLPMIRVSKFFNMEIKPKEHLFAVVIGFGERRVGLLVDELYGQQEIIIKSLGDYFKKLWGFAGAAEIGKHEVVLVLDIESLIQESVVKQKGVAHV